MKTTHLISKSLMSLLIFTFISDTILAQTASLSDFSGYQSGRQSAVLSWSSSTDQSPTGYYIEKSIDGVEYVRIGHVESASAGTSNQTYGFIDYDFSQSATYRLSSGGQADQDGGALYVSIKQTIAQEIEMYPNPTINDRISLNGPASIPFKAFMTDVNGVIVLKEFGTLDQVQLAINHMLPSLRQGAYILKLESSYGVLTNKLIKQ